MSFKKFCPKCGVETKSFVNNLCVKCFLNNNKLFELGKPRVFVCKHCSRLLIKNKWVTFSEELMAEDIGGQVKLNFELVKPKVFVELTQKSFHNYHAQLTVSGYLSKNFVEDSASVYFQLRDTTCDPCMKLNALYREAIVQLRSRSNSDVLVMLELSKNILANEKSKDSLSGTSKIVETRNGFDLWIGSKKAAAKLARELSRVYKVRPILSKKLIGEDKDGERKYRYTFCIKKE